MNHRRIQQQPRMEKNPLKSSAPIKTSRVGGPTVGGIRFEDDDANIVFLDRNCHEHGTAPQSTWSSTLRRARSRRVVSVRRFPRRSRVARLSSSNSAALSVRRLLRLKSITFNFSPSKRPGGSSSSAFRLKFSNFKDLKFLRCKLRHAKQFRFLHDKRANHHAIGRCSPRQIRKSLIFKHLKSKTFH